MNRKNYLITWIALIGLVLAATSQAQTAPGRGRSSGSRHGSVSRGHRSVGRGRGSFSGGHISIGSRHSGISFRLGFGGSGLHYRTSIIPRLGYIYRRPIILPRTPTVVIPRPVVVYDPTVTVWISNANGSQSPVVLTRDGPWYIGPRGERYFGMPTTEQLRAAYGLNCNNVTVEPADVVVYITAANGARIPVKLIATEDGYIGPKGELYTEMPTEQQLSMIYGR